jgi:transcriptional regulator with XRE-family HTH domain
MHRCQAPRWAHASDPRHDVEQRGYDLIGVVLNRRRLTAGLTQRELEDLTFIDQTVISRLENGKQYGLRWSRFAILVSVLDGLDDIPAKPRTPWWIEAGITPPAYAIEPLIEQGLLPPDYQRPVDVADSETEDVA